MNSILVLGAGFMGSGIAQVCAQAGYGVCLNDISPSALINARSAISKSLDKLHNKGMLTEPPGTIIDRIAFNEKVSFGEGFGRVIESVFEDLELKCSILRSIEEQLPHDLPFCSNTSCIPITLLGRALSNPQRMVGIHFFGPVPLMELVEVIRGEQTSDDVFAGSVDFVKSLRKRPLKVNRDIPGFVVNRILANAQQAAFDLVDRGIASPQDIDMGLKYGLGWLTGLFEIADNAGLDTCLRVAEALRQYITEENSVHDTDLLQKMVAEGKLGRKSGEGFYKYDRSR